MAGELRTSQFRFTTTADDDFVIGNPSNTSSHTTKALVFQTNQVPGYLTNPHFRCEWDSGSSSWQFVMNPTGDGPSSDFLLTGMAYLVNSQIFTGSNTFSGATTTISSTTVNLGSAITDIVNVRGILNVAGAINHTSTTNLDVVDKTITLNKGGGATSGGSSGIDIEELVSSTPTITGYIAVSSARTGWSLKAPATAGITTLIPTATSVSITMPSSTGTLALVSDLHSALTIGTANGLSLSTQALSLALASSTTTGALSSTDWNNFNSGTGSLASSYSTLTGTGSITSIATYVSGAITSAGEGYATASQFISLDAAVTTLNGTGVGSVRSTADARIAAWKTATADSTYALASNFSTLNSNFGTLTGGNYTLVSSQINTALNAYTGPNISIADIINALGTTMGTQNASVAVTASSVNGTSAQYGVTVSANGRGSGFSLLSGNVFAAKAVLTIVPATGPNNVVISGLLANTTPNTSHTVSVPSGSTAYLWAIAGGTITSGNTSNSMTFTTGPGGTITIACKISTAVSGEATVITNAVGSTSVIPVPLAGSNAAAPVIIGATANVTPNHTGLTASVSGGLISGHTYTYVWSIGNGTITSPTNTSSVTFTSGATGPYTTLSCAVTDTSIAASQPTFTLAADKVRFVDPASGTDYFTYVAPVSPATVGTFTFNGTVDLTGAVTPEELAASGYLAGLLNDHTDANTTRIDGGLIETYTIVADQLAANFAIINNIQSAGEATTHVGAYEVGTTSAPPVGFKISGTPYPTTFIGDSSPTDVQMELGTYANFGGYKVGKITEKVFAAPAVAYYSVLTLYTQYPINATTPAPLVEQLRSGISVTQSSPGHFTATEDGIYTVNLAVQTHGSGNPSYLNAYIAIKRLATIGLGFTEVAFHDWNFFASGRSEAHVSGQIAVELLAGDSIGIFYDAPGMTYANIWLTMVRLGLRAPADAINITVPGAVSRNSTGASGQTQTIPLTVSNAFGLATWSLQPGGLDGTTTPAASITGSGGDILSIVYPGDPTAYYGVQQTVHLRVDDAAASFDTQTLLYTLNSPAAIVITTLGTYYFTVFDWASESVDVLLTATGGTGTYTWTITDSTGNLTAASIISRFSRAYLSSGLVAAGTGTVTVQCASTGSSPVTKVITITVADYSGGSGGSGTGPWDPNPRDPQVCFAPGTFVLLSDGTSKVIESIVAGDSVYAINALAHQSGLKDVTASAVLRTGINTAINKMVSVKEILVTEPHPWGVVEAKSQARLWVASKLLNDSLVHRSLIVSSNNETTVVDVKAETPIEAGTSALVHSLANTDKSYFVGATENGPWFLVHNYCPIEHVLSEA